MSYGGLLISNQPLSCVTYYAAAQGGYVVANPPPAEAYAEQPRSPQQQEFPPSPGTKPSGGTWYFCNSANTYYPYLSTCPEGWQTIPAVDPPRR
ncbi:MAG: hypothetical protein WCL27_13295 [Betaproteobacteria bacterium]